MKKTIALPLLILFCLSTFVFAQETARVENPLGFLTKLQTGRSMRVSSADPDRESNWDNRRIAPGGKLVLCDVEGPGEIRHIWMTFPEAGPSWLGDNADPSELVIRMYWDESEHPAVEAPIGDFFAAGFGQRAEVNSIPIQVEGGDAYNCFWIMPFYKRAKIEIENQSQKQCGSFYYQVDYVKQEKLAEKTPYFCAQYRQEFPVKSGRDYLILDAEGEGHYVGTVLSGRARSPEWFGEGDEKFYIDGEEKPSIQGTGTEDYALNAWGMGTGTFPYFGVPILEGEWGMVGWHTTIYRWHIVEPIRFTKSLRFEIEDTGWISEDELKEGANRGHVERNDDFATVAFWYQVGQPKRYASVGTAEERKLPNLDLIIEGKTLEKDAKVTDGAISLQKGFQWTGDGQIFFRNNQRENFGAGATLEVKFNVEKEEFRQLTLRMTTANDYGIYDISLDGKPVQKHVDFYSDGVNIKELNLGSQILPTGEHTLTFKCVGRRSESQGAFLGLDSVRLRQRWDVKREAPSNIQKRD